MAHPKDAKSGAEMRVKFSSNESRKIEKKKSEWGLKDKRKTVKKMVRDFPEEGE